MPFESPFRQKIPLPEQVSISDRPTDRVHYISMGLTEFEEKLVLAEKSASQAHCVELLQLVRKEKLREPRVVAAFGKTLIEKHSWGLGNERTYALLAVVAVPVAFDCGGRCSDCGSARSVERVRAGVRGGAGPARRRAGRGKSRA